MKETIVVKYGSTSVADEFGMDQQRLSQYAEQLAPLHKRYGLIVVSSGGSEGDINFCSQSKFSLRSNLQKIK